MDIALVALGEVFEPFRLLMLLAGVCAGLVIGVIPGIGGLFGMALLVPLTYPLDPYAAVALLLGMGAVTTTSDTIPAVMIGVPGTVGAMATVLDGHQLARQNQAARVFFFWDNAPMESFFHTLKTEWVYGFKYNTRQEAKVSLFEYIEIFYNRQRRHSALQYMNPCQYELYRMAA